LILDGGGPHHDPPGTGLDESRRLTLGPDATGNLHRDPQLPNKTRDEIAVPVVTVGGGVEIDYVEIVDALLGPALGPPDRVVVQCDGFVEPAMGQANGQPVENIYPGIDVHPLTLPTPRERRANDPSWRDRLVDPNCEVASGESPQTCR
jgi:hypothetical protein